jgi:hypothetical protein
MAAHAAESAAQAAFLRCVVGNPFRVPLTIAPALLAWGGGTVRRVAEDIYERGTFDQLPVLADALDESGCSDPAILGHLRFGGEHYRGCHVLDAILGKA